MKFFIYSPILPSLEANVAYLNIYEENDKLISILVTLGFDERW